MKLHLSIAAFLVTATFFQGCGGESDSSSSSTTTQTEVTLPDTSLDSESFFGDFSWDWSDWLYLWDNFWNDDPQEVAVEDLNDQLIELVGSANSVEEFTLEGLRITLEYVVYEYFPIATKFLLEDKDWGDNSDQYLYESLYSSSENLVQYFVDFYESTIASNAPAYHRAVAVDDRSLIEKIIDELFNIISDLISNFFSSEPEVIVPDVNDTSAKIDPNQTFTFTMEDIQGQEYYVASDQYMTVTFEPDGLSGYGDIGYGIGASFESYISADKLFIDMNGVYEVAMLYKDPGYCLATQMLDTSDGSTYPAYWFSNKADYDRASNLSTAEALCYIHSSEYEVKEIAEDGELEPIADNRVGHTPVAEAETSQMVESLINGVDNTATVTDAKYFARKMRHGIFAIYTTNEQTHTLQATETEKISRELLPLAAASAMNIEEMMSGAYDATIAFQDEVNRDLNSSVSELNTRLDELISATSQAMERTTSDNAYHGVSDTTTYGDIVEFEATNIQSACGLAFFLCNEATADVTMLITNPENNGRDADVLFTTEITTSLVGSSDIEYSEVDSGQALNYLSGEDYKLNISSFNYKQSSGLMSLGGDGYLGNSSTLTFDNYEILATFQEDPLELLKFSVEVDGEITTQSGRNFIGTLLFDGENTNNSQMDGVLLGINSEPTIKGSIQTSLSSEDITAWVATHDGVTAEDAGDLDNIGNQSYSMSVSVSRDDKNVTADMLVKRDDALETWTYMMNNFSATDANINIHVDSIYLIQNGANTLVATLEKLAMNGVSLDSDLNTLINIGWDVASDFDKIGVEGLLVTMRPESGDVTIATTINVLNNGVTMSADMNATYDYAQTHLSSEGDFTTVVDSSTGENVYENSFTTSGLIQVENLYDYRYALAYTDSVQDMLFTAAGSSYQMGFRITPEGIFGGDSYGILALFGMNETYDVLENMQLRNRDEDPLGIYNRVEDRLKIKFADGVEEYMYLY